MVHKHGGHTLLIEEVIIAMVARLNTGVTSISAVSLAWE